MCKTLAVGIHKNSLRGTGREISTTCAIRGLLGKRLPTAAKRYLSRRKMSFLERIMP